MTLLQANSVSISVAGKPICGRMNFLLGRGECWGVLGMNGAGKTTLLHVLAGLRKPDNGEILLEGRDINTYHRRSLARKVGLLFQDSEDVFPGSVFETVLAGRYPYLPFWSLESSDDIRLAMEALKEVGLLSMARRQVNTLSGGERRRLALATLFVQQPDIWLLDEPTNHLDLHHQISLLGMSMKKLHDLNGAALMVLHDVNLATRFCTHALLMVEPDTLIQGPVSEVVTADNLQRLYRHPVRMVDTEEVRLFYPV